MQKVDPNEYAAAALSLPDVFLEDLFQKEAEIPWLIEKTNDCTNVLELGYGGGLVAKALHDAGRRVLVVDGSWQLVFRCKEAGIAAEESMFESFDGTFGAFHCTIASFVLEHVADPLALLKRAREWAPRLIVVIANANSWHRRLAVKMGLQPELTTLSARDHAVGHYKVYAPEDIEAGWRITETKGLGFKPLHNAAAMNLDWKIQHAMAGMEVRYEDAAVLGIVCERA